MKEGLKPCPFCGGQVEMHYTGSSDWEVVCGTCPVETRFWVSAQKHGYGEGERMEAARRWNQRADQSTKAVDLLRGLHKIIMSLSDNFEKPITDDNVTRWLALNSAQVATAEFLKDYEAALPNR